MSPRLRTHPRSTAPIAALIGTLAAGCLMAPAFIAPSGLMFLSEAPCTPPRSFIGRGRAALRASVAAARNPRKAAAAQAAVPSIEQAEKTSFGRGLAAMAIGAVAGALGGSLGLGGGFLVVPALTSLLAVEPRFSIGTSAAVVLAVSCAACRAYVSRGLASPRAAAIIAVAALTTARIGATTTSKVNPKTLKKVFGGWLIIVSCLIGAKAFGLFGAGTSFPGAGEVAPVLPLLGLGAATGFISGLLGVGGGTVLVPALTLGFGFTQPEAQGCALLGMIPPAIVSTYTHWSKGNVDKGIVAYAVAGALMGGVAGSMAAAHLPEKALRIAFSVVLACVGVKYLSS
eukprot:CAMPEP_0177184058 /NCGR_PEP_ID=MMETSP0367-20130122/17355_1 /TAXON_ID=447022 ORGANISM="Scrippsiella hangoei-like, Strain SHHI-4" /NCGR_SAMPLE_ID=MMETSP0367 /ASSEMBLY_ACC=CAM_ASM_000362 /LENGTH=342 /DNA_ID=CAMNT_0018631149 /DNA_START=32 /DNA_END=1060 /DNA_ORIENTATION=+